MKDPINLPPWWLSRVAPVREESWNLPLLNAMRKGSGCMNKAMIILAPTAQIAGHAKLKP